MTCYHPLQAWRSRITNLAGKRGITLNPAAGYTDLPIALPCGQCIGCRLERSQQWAARCVHESELHEHNSFITLTYDNKHLPTNGSLNKKHFQDFMKRLRKDVSPLLLRFYHCGEYGDQNRRPHYHALIFGYDFPDKTAWKKTKADSTIYRSEQLEKNWTAGHSSVGHLTPQSAAYCARYIMKKITGQQAPNHYENTYDTIDQTTGEVKTHTVQMTPEYTTMSRKPGIGQDWYNRFSADLFPDDFTIIDGKKKRVPRYYDNQLEKENPELLNLMKLGRKRKARQHKANTTPERLRVRETIQQLKLNMLKKEL